MKYKRNVNCLFKNFCFWGDCVCTIMHIPLHRYRGSRATLGIILSSHHVSTRNWAQTKKHSHKLSYPLNYLFVSHSLGLSEIHHISGNDLERLIFLLPLLSAGMTSVCHHVSFSFPRMLEVKPRCSGMLGKYSPDRTTAPVLMWQLSSILL